MKSSMLLHVYESFDWSWRRSTRVILPSAFVSRILIGKGCNLRACVQGYTTHLAFRYQSYDQMMPIGDRYSHPCSHPIFAPYDKFRIPRMRKGPCCRREGVCQLVQTFGILRQHMSCCGVSRLVQLGKTLLATPLRTRCFFFRGRSPNHHVIKRVSLKLLIRPYLG